jgi:hypothetical protein
VETLWRTAGLERKQRLCHASRIWFNTTRSWGLVRLHDVSTDGRSRPGRSVATSQRQMCDCTGVYKIMHELGLPVGGLCRGSWLDEGWLLTTCVLITAGRRQHLEEVAGVQMAMHM